jgi:hypothetical protein
VITNRADEARPQSVSLIDWNLKPTFTARDLQVHAAEGRFGDRNRSQEEVEEREMKDSSANCLDSSGRSRPGELRDPCPRRRRTAAAVACMAYGVAAAPPGGGGCTRDVQANNNRADVRTNNVRKPASTTSTSTGTSM